MMFTAVDLRPLANAMVLAHERAEIQYKNLLTGVTEAQNALKAVQNDYASTWARNGAPRNASHMKSR